MTFLNNLKFQLFFIHSFIKIGALRVTDKQTDFPIYVVKYGLRALVIGISKFHIYYKVSNQPLLLRNRNKLITISISSFTLHT